MVLFQLTFTHIKSKTELNLVFSSNDYISVLGAWSMLGDAARLTTACITINAVHCKVYSVHTFKLA